MNRRPRFVGYLVRAFSFAVLAAGVVEARAEDYALIVGVGKYDEPVRFPEVLTSTDDARTLAATLKRSGFIVTEMNDKSPDGLRPTRTNIRDEIKKVCKDKDQDSTVFIFLTGHGMSLNPKAKGGPRLSCFVPSDATFRDQVFVNLLDIHEDVLALMQGCRASRKFLFVDACQDHQSLAAEPTIVVPTETQVASTKVHVFFSCDDGQISKVLDGQGIFTSYLIKALKGEAADEGTDRITLLDLKRFIGHRVTAFVEDKWKGVKQTPVLLSHDDSVEVLRFTLPGSRLTIVGEDEPSKFDGTPRQRKTIAEVRDQDEPFEDATFTGTFRGPIVGKRFINCRFKNCTFRGATSMLDCVMIDCVFEDADLTRAQHTASLKVIGVEREQWKKYKGVNPFDKEKEPIFREREFVE